MIITYFSHISTIIPLKLLDILPNRKQQGGFYVKKNYTKIVIDMMMAITFVLLMNPRVLDGLPFHEIAGLIIGVAILVHISLNYRWVINTAKKIFDPKLPTKTRFSFLLNILLLLSMASVIITGILISRVVFPNLAIQGGHSIRGLHSFSADATLALVGLHIGVHWQWIMSICKRAFKSKEGKLRKGVLASVVLSIAILTGGIQWFSSASTPIKGDFNPKQIQQSGQTFNNPNAGNAAFTNQGRPDGDFGEGRFEGRGGHDGHGHSSNPFLVILDYFAIWAVIIIPAYILEKRILRNKRKENNVHLQKS
jgi:cytochrome b561